MSYRQWYIVAFLEAVQSPAVEEDMHTYNPTYGTVSQLRAAAQRLHKRGFIRWGKGNGRTGWQRMPPDEDPVPYRPSPSFRRPDEVLRDRLY